MSERINAPFTPSQVAALERWQACGWVHPLECCGSPMAPHKDGLGCPGCSQMVVQSWAPAVCFGPLPPEPRYYFLREGRDWEIRSYYAADVGPPKTPYTLARHDWCCGDHTKDIDVEIAMKREDLGYVEVRRVIDGVPQAWVVVKDTFSDGKR